MGDCDNKTTQLNNEQNLVQVIFAVENIIQIPAGKTETPNRHEYIS